MLISAKFKREKRNQKRGKLNHRLKQQKTEQHFYLQKKDSQTPQWTHFAPKSTFLLNFSQNVPYMLSSVAYYAHNVVKCAGRSQPWRIQRWIKRRNPNSWD